MWAMNCDEVLSIQSTRATPTSATSHEPLSKKMTTNDSGAVGPRPYDHKTVTNRPMLGNSGATVLGKLPADGAGHEASP